MRFLDVPFRVLQSLSLRPSPHESHPEGCRSGNEERADSDPHDVPSQNEDYRLPRRCEPQNENQGPDLEPQQNAGKCVQASAIFHA